MVRRALRRRKLCLRRWFRRGGGHGGEFSVLPDLGEGLCVWEEQPPLEERLQAGQCFRETLSSVQARRGGSLKGELCGRRAAKDRYARILLLSRLLWEHLSVCVFRFNSCLTLCGPWSTNSPLPMEFSPVRILVWVAISSSRKLLRIRE